MYHFKLNRLVHEFSIVPPISTAIQFTGSNYEEVYIFLNTMIAKKDDSLIIIPGLGDAFEVNPTQ